MMAALVELDPWGVVLVLFFIAVVELAAPRVNRRPDSGYRKGEWRG